jgi:hypothetical protein
MRMTTKRAVKDTMMTPAMRNSLGETLAVSLSGTADAARTIFGDTESISRACFLCF